MPSKAVTHRSKGARAVKAVANHQTQPLAAALEDSLGGGQGLNVAALLAALLTRLDSVAQAMANADEVHEAELADDPTAREARDAALGDLTTTLTALREALSGVYQPRVAKAVFRSNTPRDPAQLVAFAKEIANNLRSTTLPAPRLKVASLDVAAQASELEARRAALDNAMEVVASEEREAQTTLSAKTSAIDDYDRVFDGVTKMLEGAFILAKMDDFARRVRPSTRRAGRTELVEEEEEAEEAEAEAAAGS